MPLIEVLPSTGPSRTTQPGWAYVPDTGPIAAVQLPARKRGRDGNLIGSSAKQQKAIEQRLKDLDKENYKDAPVPIPKSDRDRKGRKMTSNVRRILGYNRNFGHYLADEEALIAAGGSTSVAAPASTVAVAAPRDVRRGGVGAGKDTPTASTSLGNAKTGRHGVAMPPPPAKPATPILKQEDVATTSSPTSPSSPKHSRSRSQQTPPTSTPTDPPSQQAYPPALDKDPLLRTLNLPPRPSDRVMAQLLAEPPLSYSAARAKPLEPEKQVPDRHFCVICGYWGKVKCRRCGERTCGLMECWRGHETGGCGAGFH